MLLTSKGACCSVVETLLNSANVWFPIDTQEKRNKTWESLCQIHLVSSHSSRTFHETFFSFSFHCPLSRILPWLRPVGMSNKDYCPCCGPFCEKLNRIRITLTSLPSSSWSCAQPPVSAGPSEACEKPSRCLWVCWSSVRYGNSRVDPGAFADL
jgi:hypothetical protein